MIGSVNVANLLLARASARSREMAVRQALGAARKRLVRQLLTESLLLSLLGGVAGLAVLFGMKGFLLRLVPESLPRLNDLSINWTVMLFALAVSIAAGVIFGLAPARQAGAVESGKYAEGGGARVKGLHGADAHAARAGGDGVRAVADADGGRGPAAAQFLGFVQGAAGIQSAACDVGPVVAAQPQRSEGGRLRNGCSGGSVCARNAAAQPIAAGSAGGGPGIGAIDSAAPRWQPERADRGRTPDTEQAAAFGGAIGGYAGILSSAADSGVAGPSLQRRRRRECAAGRRDQPGDGGDLLAG